MNDDDYKPPVQPPLPIEGIEKSPIPLGRDYDKPKDEPVRGNNYLPEQPNLFGRNGPNG